MPRATGNLLDLLELLQSRPAWTGRELSGRLRVDPRTVRRYVTTLQELGIPVAGERGHGGGYRLQPGYRLPPLMLDDDETAAVVLGLVAAHRLGLGDPAAAEAALAKLRRVLPARLRGRVDALETALRFTLPATEPTGAPAARVLALADAVHRRRRITAGYRRADETASERDLSPYGLVVHSGRWYLSAFDHARDELRTFRVDRMDPPTDTGAAAPPPVGHDPVEHVQRSLARVPWRWAVEVRLELPLEAARQRLPPTLAEFEADGDATRMTMRVQSLDWMATVLAGLGADFEVVAPDELRGAVEGLADRLVRQVAPAQGRCGTPPT